VSHQNQNSDYRAAPQPKVAIVSVFSNALRIRDWCESECEKWDWFEWNTFPRPIFIPLKNLLKERIDPTK